MRKALTALVLGTVVLGQSVVAIAATVKPASPAAAVAGRINNRAVLSVAAAQGAADACVPKNDQDKSCEGEGANHGGSGGGGTLPLVAAGVAAAVAAAAAGGGGGGKGPSSP